MICLLANIFKKHPAAVRLALRLLMVFTLFSLCCAIAALICVTIENYKDGFHFFDFICNIALIFICIFLVLTELPVKKIDDFLASYFPIYSAARRCDLYALGFTEIFLLCFILEGLNESENTKEALGAHYFRLYSAGGIIIGTNGFLNVLAALVFRESYYEDGQPGYTAKQLRFPSLSPDKGARIPKAAEVFTGDATAETIDQRDIEKAYGIAHARSIGTRTTTRTSAAATAMDDDTRSSWYSINPDGSPINALFSGPQQYIRDEDERHTQQYQPSQVTPYPPVPPLPTFATSSRTQPLAPSASQRSNNFNVAPLNWARQGRDLLEREGSVSRSTSTSSVRLREPKVEE